MKTWGDMTDAEQGELLLAYHRGEVIEVYTKAGWRDLSPLWQGHCKYRIKPKETTYTGKAWAAHVEGLMPSFSRGKWFETQVKGTYTATHVNGNPVKIVWEADQ